MDFRTLEANSSQHWLAVTSPPEPELRVLCEGYAETSPGGCPEDERVGKCWANARNHRTGCYLPPPPPVSLPPGPGQTSSALSSSLLLPYRSSRGSEQHTPVPNTRTQGAVELTWQEETLGKASPLSGWGRGQVEADTPTPPHARMHPGLRDTAYPVTLTCGDRLNARRNFRSGQIEQTPGTCEQAPPCLADTFN